MAPPSPLKLLFLVIKELLIVTFASMIFKADPPSVMLLGVASLSMTRLRVRFVPLPVTLNIRLSLPVIPREPEDVCVLIVILDVMVGNCEFKEISQTSGEIKISLPEPDEQLPLAESVFALRIASCKVQPLGPKFIFTAFAFALIKMTIKVLIYNLFTLIIQSYFNSLSLLNIKNYSMINSLNIH